LHTQRQEKFNFELKIFKTGQFVGQIFKTMCLIANKESEIFTLERFYRAEKLKNAINWLMRNMAASSVKLPLRGLSLIVSKNSAKISTLTCHRALN
jgi:hypothetical protein